MSDYKVGSVFKYHNRIVKVTKVDGETVIAEPVFKDNHTGNLQFNIPVAKLAEVNITPITDKKTLNNLLKTILDSETVVIKPEIADNPYESSRTHNQLDITQSIDLLKVFADQQSDTGHDKNSSKVRDLIASIAKEISISFNIELSKATELLTKHLKSRKQSIRDQA